MEAQKVHVFQMEDDSDDMWLIEAETREEAERKLIKHFREEEFDRMIADEFMPDEDILNLYQYLDTYSVIK